MHLVGHQRAEMRLVWQQGTDPQHLVYVAAEHSLHAPANGQVCDVVATHDLACAEAWLQVEAGAAVVAVLEVA